MEKEIKLTKIEKEITTLKSKLSAHDVLLCDTNIGIANALKTLTQELQAYMLTTNRVLVQLPHDIELKFKENFDLIKNDLIEFKKQYEIDKEKTSWVKILPALSQIVVAVGVVFGGAVFLLPKLLK